MNETVQQHIINLASQICIEMFKVIESDNDSLAESDRAKDFIF